MTTTMTDYWMVIAWITLDRAEPTGSYSDRWRLTSILRALPNPRACVWITGGSDEDLAKAQAHARLYGYAVFTYPDSEREPLVRARSDVLAAYHRQQLRAV